MWEFVLWFSVQTEGLPEKSTDAAACENAPGNMTSDGAEQSDMQKGEEIPRGMIVATSDLQMRALYAEDEKEVSARVFDILDSSSICAFCFEMFCIFQHGHGSLHGYLIKKLNLDTYTY